MPRGQKSLEDISILEDIGLEDIRLPCSWNNGFFFNFFPYLLLLKKKQPKKQTYPQEDQIEY